MRLFFKKDVFTVFIIIIFFSCKVTPYSGNDVYEKVAKLPDDEGVHYKNSLEWWYFTGHLKDKYAQREYGVEYVFFHFNPQNKDDYLMVNVAITDPQNQKFYYDSDIEKLNYLMGFEIPFDLNLPQSDTIWNMSGISGEYHLNAEMKNHQAGINLNTSLLKPALLHNNTGYEKYGQYATAGYISYPRLKAEGQIMVEGELIDVEGELWYDRQWNCIGVYQKEVAWDWISIQFDDIQEELMVYQLYHVADSNNVLGGSLFTKDNTYKSIPDDLELVALENWQSPDSKITYPVKWQIKIPSWDLDVVATAVMPNQELKIKFNAFVSMHYWEGMCKVNGIYKGKPVSGNSYIEMTNRGVYK